MTETISPLLMIKKTYHQLLYHLTHGVIIPVHYYTILPVHLKWLCWMLRIRCGKTFMLSKSFPKVMPIRVIWTKLIIVKSLTLLIITTINMTIIIYLPFFICIYMGLRVDVHVSTSITVHYHAHLVPSIYNFMID